MRTSGQWLVFTKNSSTSFLAGAPTSPDFRPHAEKKCYAARKMHTPPS
jgi:hypothetical protein